MRSLSRYPTPSAESASSFIASPSSTYCESTSTPTEGWRARISSAARRPSSLWVGRQPDVDDRDVQLMAVDLAQQLVGVLALGDHVEAGVAQQAGEPLAQQHAVLGDGYAHGISALTSRAAAARRPDPQPATERLDPVGQAAQAGAALAVGAAHPVVDDLDHERCRSTRSTSTVAELRVGVLADVREALGDDVVRGHLEPLGKPAVDRDRCSRTGTGAARRATRAPPPARAR